MSGFVRVDSMTGPALVRLDRVVLVRPSPDGTADRSLLVLETGTELVVRQPAADLVALVEGSARVGA